MEVTVHYPGVIFPGALQQSNIVDGSWAAACVQTSLFCPRCIQWFIFLSIIYIFGTAPILLWQMYILHSQKDYYINHGTFKIYWRKLKIHKRCFHKHKFFWQLKWKLALNDWRWQKHNELIIHLKCATDLFDCKQD